MMTINITSKLPNNPNVPGTHFLLNGRRGVLRTWGASSALKLPGRVELLKESSTAPGLYITMGWVSDLGPIVTAAIQDALAMHTR